MPWKDVRQLHNGWFLGNGWPDTSMIQTFASSRCHLRPMTQSIARGIFQERSGGIGKMPSGTRRIVSLLHPRTWPHAWDVSVLRRRHHCRVWPSGAIWHLRLVGTHHGWASGRAAARWRSERLDRRWPPLEPRHSAEDPSRLPTSHLGSIDSRGAGGRPLQARSARTHLVGCALSRRVSRRAR
jgi:hypothetical protein